MRVDIDPVAGKVEVDLPIVITIVAVEEQETTMMMIVIRAAPEIMIVVDTRMTDRLGTRNINLAVDAKKMGPTERTDLADAKKIGLAEMIDVADAKKIDLVDLNVKMIDMIGARLLVGQNTTLKDKIDVTHTVKMSLPREKTLHLLKKKDPCHLIVKEWHYQGCNFVIKLLVQCQKGGIIYCLCILMSIKRSNKETTNRRHDTAH